MGNLKKARAASAKLQNYFGKWPLGTWFLAIFIFFGAIFILLVPPGWGTDEPSHIYRTYQLSRGDVLSESVTTPGTGLPAFGGKMPSTLVQFFDQTEVTVPNAPLLSSYKLNNFYHKHPGLRSIKDSAKRTDINFSGAALYSPVTYAIYVPVFWLGKLFGLSFFWMIMLCRVVALLSVAAAFFFAIKLTPIGKWIFLAVGLMPTVVAQSATVGADAPQLATTVLFVAGTLRLMFQTRRPSLWHYWLLAFLGAIMATIKFVYAPLLLLLLLVAFVRKEPRHRGTIMAVCLMIILALVPGIVWQHLVAYINTNSNPQANVALQKQFILHHPATYLKVLYHTFFTNQQSPLKNISGEFIWGSAPLPAIFTYLSISALAISLFVRSKREQAMELLRSSLWLRVALGAVVILTAILIATALYVYSTPLHQSSVVSIQARYFVPILPLVLLMFYGNFAKNQRDLKIAIIIISVIVLIGGVETVYSRLYQTLPPILN